jgi:hypothetical protein
MICWYAGWSTDIAKWTPVPWHAAPLHVACGDCLGSVDYTSDIKFSLKPPATSGFAARAGDAMTESVVSHSSHKSTCLRSRFHAFLLTSRLGPRLTATVRVRLGALERTENSELSFVTETARQLNVTSPVGPHEGLSLSAL